MSITLTNVVLLGKAKMGGGITPTGTKNITTNGTHDVAAYEYADVQVPTTAPDRYLEFSVDASGKLIHSPTVSSIINLNGVTDVGDYALYTAYAGNTNITGPLDLSSLTNVTGNTAFGMAFRNCTGITSVDLSSLKSAGQQSFNNAFYGCTGITSGDLSSLEAVNSYSFSQTFMSCTGITSVDLSSLINISAAGSYCFSGTFTDCTGITSVDLSSLIFARGGSCLRTMFSGCTNLTSANLSHLCVLSADNAMMSMFSRTSLSSLSFPNLAYTTTNLNGAFNNTLNYVTGCTVHFPAEWQTAMSTWSNITNGMGGTNTTILFDLPNVTTLDLTIITEATGGLSNAFANNTYPNITKIDLSNLTTVSGSSACAGMCKNTTSITSVDLSSLTTVSASQACNQMFYGCTGITGTIDLSSLTTISGSIGCAYMFYGCTGITGVNLSSLTTMGDTACQNMFAGCNITSADFSSLEHVGKDATSSMFENCTGLTTLSFPALKTVGSAPFNWMLHGVTGCTVHFPSNLSSYNFNCGGTNTTVLYDLPATA